MEKVRKEAVQNFATGFFVTVFLLVLVNIIASYPFMGNGMDLEAIAGWLVYLLFGAFVGALLYVYTLLSGRIRLLEERLAAAEAGAQPGEKSGD